MLRTVKSRMSGIRLIPGLVTFSGGVPSVTQFAGNFASVTDGGTGIVGLTLNDGGSDIIGVFATPVTLGDYITASVNPTVQGATLKVYDSANAAADHDFHVVFAVTDQRNPTVQTTSPKEPRSPVHVAMANAVVLPIDYTSSGNVAVANNSLNTRDATFTYNGVGDVTITFLKPFAQPPFFIGNPLNASARRISVVTTKTSIRIKTSNNAGAAADSGVVGMLLGSFSSYQGGHLRRSLKSHRWAPRLNIFRIESNEVDFGAGMVTEGTFSGGSFAMTMAPTTTGDFTVAPVVATFSNSDLYTHISSRSVSALTVLGRNSAGTQSGNTAHIYGLVLGWDHAAVTAMR